MNFNEHSQFMQLGKRGGEECGEMLALKDLSFTCQHIPLAALWPEPTSKADYDTHPNPDPHFFCRCSELHKAVGMTPECIEK